VEAPEGSIGRKRPAPASRLSGRSYRFQYATFRPGSRETECGNRAGTQSIRSLGLKATFPNR